MTGAAEGGGAGGPDKDTGVASCMPDHCGVSGYSSSYSSSEEISSPDVKYPDNDSISSEAGKKTWRWTLYYASTFLSK